MKTFTGYIGTYDSPQSFGVYRFTVDAETGGLSLPQLFFQTKNAKCVSLWDGLLAATMEQGGKAGICLLDAHCPEAPLLSEALFEKNPACFIVQDEVLIYTANYHEGIVLIYRKDGALLKLVKRIDIAPKAGCHQVILHGDFFLVPCLELDAVYLYDRRSDFTLAGKISFPAGSGPRHGVFDRNHARFFIVSEHSNQLFTFRAGAGAEFILEQTDSILPPGTPTQSASAAIRLSADERFLYVSTRGADLITVFRISNGFPERVQQVACGGSHPRDFLIEPGGSYLLVVNRTSNELISFRLNRENGHLEEIRARVPVIEGIGITLEGK